MFNQRRAPHWWIRLIALVMIAAGPCDAAPVTNADVAKLLKAGLPPDIVLQMIGSGEPAFDTSADAIIELKAAGASDAVIAAILARSVAPNAPGVVTPEPPTSVEAYLRGRQTDGRGRGAFSRTGSRSVTLRCDGKETELLSTRPQTRGKARALGLGGGASYLVLPGAAATVRIGREIPEFVVAVQSQTNPQNGVVLVRLETRRNGTREILHGGGFGSYSTGFPQERVIPLTFASQPTDGATSSSRATHLAKPSTRLSPGEYAVVVVGNLCYDFGVD